MNSENLHNPILANLTVTTGNITNNSFISAVSGGNVTDDGKVLVTTRGVCWSTAQNPTIHDNKTNDGSGTGNFTSNIIGLDPGTTYYVRAYATNEVGTIYGEQKTFTTLTLSDEQKERFIRLFNIYPDDSNDSNSIILQTVLDFNFTDHDDEYEITYDEFKEHFYVDNIPSVDENIENLNKNILHGKRYHYIHSNGKNGKTTFNKRFIHENNEIHKPIYIDFSDLSQSNTEYTHRLLTVVINSFNLLVRQQKDCIDTIMKCIRHISNAQINICISNPINRRAEYLNMFSLIGYKIDQFIQEIREENNNRKNGNIAEVFKAQFEAFVFGEYKKSELELQLKITNELFNLLLLVYLKMHDEEKDINEKNLLFIFDNIDDILTNTSEYISSILIPNIDKFIRTIKPFINTNGSFIDEKLISKTNFIFTYRTANYASSMVTIKNHSAKERNYELLSAPVYALSSVNNTNDIIRRKLNFYEGISVFFNFEKSPNFYFLKSILDSYHLNADRNDKHIAKLWNGNSFIFSKCFYYLCHNTDIKFTEDDLKALNNDTYRNILRGIFVHYVVKFYCDEANELFINNTTLFEAFQYIFKKEIDDKICNLLRLFLSYVINYNDKNKRQNSAVKSNSDIFIKGVGLYDILEELSKLKNSDNKPVYDKEKYIDLFDNVFYSEIDSLDYFIICVKKTNNNQGNHLIKTYDFTKELELFFDEKKSDTLKKIQLNQVRVYYNSNAKVFLNIVKRNFEVFSVITKNELSSPLPINIEIYPRIEEKEKFDRKFQFGFNKDSILKNVFNAVNDIVKSTVDFYVLHMHKVYSPQQYIQDSYFTDSNSKDASFLFDSIIANHITYIEKVRQLVINQKIEYEFKDSINSDFQSNKTNIIPSKILADINAHFIYWIEKYIKLFEYAYYEIRTNTGEIDSHSEKTFSMFQQFKKLIDEKIKKSNYNDFSTKIER